LLPFLRETKILIDEVSTAIDRFSKQASGR